MRPDSAVTALPAPLGERARLPAMDVLRGLALLGIALMNLEGFAGPPASMGTGVDPALSGADRWVDAAIYVLVQGKFIALFSLLFGAGFAGLAVRAEREGWALGPVWLRRCAGLLLIGLAHALLVWSGDILVTYALCGLLLLAFREVIGGVLAWIGVALFLVPAGLMLGVAAMGVSLAHDPAWQQALHEQAVHAQAQAQTQIGAYAHGDYLAATHQRLEDFVSNLQVLPLYGSQVFGLFLIGGWLGGVLAEPARHTRALQAMRWIALPLGLGAMGLAVWLAPWIGPGRTDARTCLGAALASAASLPICLGYVAWTLRWLQGRPSLTGLCAALAATGRLALSNYLLQSLVFTMLFYGYGFGAFGLARRWQLPLALALFALQLVLSRWWQKRGLPGPAEWALRALAYARPPHRAGQR
ncbi:DUF418 domain-containing protein [Pseudoxanthomonas winnipegensis]|uniref:DUF418 domain-containing protein n=1 Tax=Pseudoxanthomonas winnipegensis TaxID=2480810 RepID=A0A4Q8M4C1_9GAMM|nr:DUF418 domain-containing protein [Pseudoxanthomonas winnipegensis]TAA41610.1 DUF418 domain-containing protein [Pseudoxanthomonas winnipegensis]